MAIGRFEYLAENDDFLVHGIAGGRFSAFLDRLLPAMNAVFLHLAGRDLGEDHVAKER